MFSCPPNIPDFLFCDCAALGLCDVLREASSFVDFSGISLFGRRPARSMGIDLPGQARIVRLMRQTWTLVVMLAFFIVPISAMANESHVPSYDSAASVQLSDHENGGKDLPAPDRGAEHCAHCVPMPLRTEAVTVSRTTEQTSTHFIAVTLPRLQYVARAEKPPRH